jgi:hypothetical protein
VGGFDDGLTVFCLLVISYSQAAMSEKHPHLTKEDLALLKKYYDKDGDGILKDNEIDSKSLSLNLDPSGFIVGIA